MCDRLAIHLSHIAEAEPLGIRRHLHDPEFRFQFDALVEPHTLGVAFDGDGGWSDFRVVAQVLMQPVEDRSERGILRGKRPRCEQEDQNCTCAKAHLRIIAHSTHQAARAPDYSARPGAATITVQPNGCFIVY
jgi:hypothetical protein